MTELPTDQHAMTAPGRSESSMSIAQSRSAQEVQAAMVIAQKFPRDIFSAENRILQSCQRTRLAEQAMYTYSRGGSKIEGPSIRLAEVMAQAWGNLDFGIVELNQGRENSEVMAYCWDLETNTRQTKIFTVPHKRHTKKGDVPLTDPRDIYENNANMGARRLRACILGIIPSDVQEAAVEQCRKTLEGDGSVPVIDRVKKMAAAMAEYGVTREMLEERLQHRLEATSATELVNLRGIYTSMKDGMSKKEDWFQVVPIPEGDTSATEALAGRIKGDPAVEAPDEDAVPLAEKLKAEFLEVAATEEIEGQGAVDAWNRFVKLTAGSYPADCADEQWHALADHMTQNVYSPATYTRAE